MYKPKSGSLRDEICRYILQHGPMRFTDIVRVFSKHPYGTVSSSIFKLRMNNALFEDGEVHSLTEQMHAYLTGAEIPKPPEVEAKPVVFKPLAAEHMAWTKLIREPIREMSFQNGSTDMRIGYRI